MSESIVSRLISTNAKFILLVAPTWIGLFVGFWLLVHAPGPKIAALWNLLFLTLLGITLSVLGVALKAQLVHWHEVSYDRQHQLLRNTLGQVPSVEMLRGLVGDQPKLFLHYLSEEKRSHDRGLEHLRTEGRWPLTTARSYEAILNTFERAEDISIIDHDIRRWFEILQDGHESVSFKTSTTFNYSFYILELIKKKFEENGNSGRLRRILIVNDDILPCLKASEAERSWEDLSPATRVLLKLWDFERWMKKEEKLDLRSKDFGSRIVKASDLTAMTKQKAVRFKDIVLLEQKICFQEDLTYNEQGGEVLSVDTRSYIITKKDKLEEMADFFEKLWSRAKSAEDFPEYQDHLNHVSSPVRV